MAETSQVNPVDTSAVPSRSYASAVKSTSDSINVVHGPSIPINKSTNILVVPKKDMISQYATSKETKEVFQKIIKPSDFNLKVNKITSARNCGVRIEALSADISRIKDSKELDKAGLKVEQMSKVNPRLILRDVPVGMSRDDLRTELIALNLDKHKDTEVNVVYVFPPKKNRSTCNCIIEVSPLIRTKLLRGSNVYINYSACRLEDYVRVLQCYRCLAFGHLSKNCTASSTCGHCAGDHEMKDCTRREESALCGNCKRWSNDDCSHSALDGKKCPILRKRLLEKTKNINYG